MSIQDKFIYKCFNCGNQVSVDPDFCQKCNCSVFEKQKLDQSNEYQV
jgi:DNA-directed RNA polymerase subunit RPC12/RpoP